MDIEYSLMQDCFRLPDWDALFQLHGKVIYIMTEHEADYINYVDQTRRSKRRIKQTEVLTEVF